MEEKFLINSKKNWEFDYTEKKSLTNKDSFLINIKKIKKKKLNENNFCN